MSAVVSQPHSPTGNASIQGPSLSWRFFLLPVTKSFHQSSRTLEVPEERGSQGPPGRGLAGTCVPELVRGADHLLDLLLEVLMCLMEDAFSDDFHLLSRWASSKITTGPALTRACPKTTSRFTSARK